MKKQENMLNRKSLTISNWMFPLTMNSLYTFQLTLVYVYQVYNVNNSFIYYLCIFPPSTSTAFAPLCIAFINFHLKITAKIVLNLKQIMCSIRQVLQESVLSHSHTHTHNVHISNGKASHLHTLCTYIDSPQMLEMICFMCRFKSAL